MSFYDAAIDSGGEAKVIGVDNQTTHRVSLAGRESQLHTADRLNNLSGPRTDFNSQSPQL
jgi:hypothetical protein